MITQAKLKNLFNYDLTTGIFTRRVTKGRFCEGDRAGHVNARGYVMMMVDYKLYYAHRLAWLYVYGIWPGDLDHINRNESDNRIDNLREATQSQNNANQRLTARRGVTLTSTGYLARICVNYTQISLGTYKTLKEAATVYREAHKRYFGEFSSVN